ncbi:MAG: YdcF family protein [Gemmatimonadota bacterium]|nr:YdcF family protein [Gemmatimonadota bacterium]
MNKTRSRTPPPVERVVIGALMGLAASLAISNLLLHGITTSRALACVIALVLGALLYVTAPRAAWILLSVSLAAWCVVAGSPLARWLSDGLVRSDPVPQSVDAVVVLSGSVTKDGMLGGEALDRLLEGVSLIRSGHASTIVISRPHPFHDRSITTDTDQRRIIALLPVPPRIVVIDNVTSTRTEALGAARMISPATTRTIALVTSPLHTRRACRVFENVGYHVVCVPSESRDIALRSLITPSDRIAAFRMAVSERLAFALYGYRGWL